MRDCGGAGRRGNGGIGAVFVFVSVYVWVFDSIVLVCCCCCGAWEYSGGESSLSVSSLPPHICALDLISSAMFFQMLRPVVLMLFENVSERCPWHEVRVVRRCAFSRKVVA